MIDHRELLLIPWRVRGGADMGHGEPRGFDIVAEHPESAKKYQTHRWPVVICRVADESLACLIVACVNEKIKSGELT